MRNPLPLALAVLLTTSCVAATAPGPAAPTAPTAKVATPAGTPRLAMITLATPDPTDVAIFRADYEKRFGEGLANVDAGTGTGNSGTFVFDVPRGHVVVGYMAAPIPWSDLETPARFAWLWPEATTTLRAHQAHVIVALSPRGPADAMADAKALTHVLASLVAVTPSAVGVYWGEAPAVASREMVLASVDAESVANPSVFLWLGFWPATLDDGRRGLTTKGLAAFGYKELLLVSPSQGLGELLRMIVDVAFYVLVNGPVLKDGDTFGGSEQERWPVKHVGAPWDASQMVIQLEIP